MSEERPYFHGLVNTRIKWFLKLKAERLVQDYFRCHRPLLFESFIDRISKTAEKGLMRVSSSVAAKNPQMHKQQLLHKV